MSSNMNGVMLQGFHWFLKPDFPGSQSRSLWQFLKDEANHFRKVGIDAVWIPPAYKAASHRSNSVGYDVYDHFDLGEFIPEGETTARTKYGTKPELIEAVQSLHGNDAQKRIHVYADVVLNHKTGGQEDDYWQAIRVEKDNRSSERWGDGFERGMIEIKAYTRFDYPERGGRYSSFQWRVKHFDGVDTAISIRQNGSVFNDPKDKYIYRFLYNEPEYDPAKKSPESWVSLEKGNYDYLTGCDFDYNRYDVREEMKDWGTWFAQELDLDGIRLDAVKHISADYIREWLGHVRWKMGRNLFAVAEYIAGSTEPLHQYITRVTAEGQYPQPVTLFDFPLHFKFKSISYEGDGYDLRNLYQGTLMAEQSALAVTYVENHDYEFGRDFNSHVQEWFKPLAYAFILLRAQGYPCIFFPDYYGSLDWYSHQAQKPGREYLDLLLKLRKQFALGEERYYTDKNVVGWVRMGFVPGAKGAMAVVINTAYRAVKAIRMNTGRFNKRFYHLATIKLTESNFLVVRNRYDLYGNKAEGLWTDANGYADFVADGGTVSVWIEDGVGLDD